MQAIKKRNEEMVRKVEKGKRRMSCGFIIEGAKSKLGKSTERKHDYSLYDKLHRHRDIKRSDNEESKAIFTNASLTNIHIPNVSIEDIENDIV